MFEVIVTYRADWAEQIVDRYPTAEEARTVADRILASHRDHVLRVLVRPVREAQIKH